MPGRPLFLAVNPGQRTTDQAPNGIAHCENQQMLDEPQVPEIHLRPRRPAPVEWTGAPAEVDLRIVH